MCQLLGQNLEQGSEHITFNSVMLAELVKCRTTWASGWEGLRIESPQVNIPNGVDVLKLCFIEHGLGNSQDSDKQDADEQLV